MMIFGWLRMSRMRFVCPCWYGIFSRCWFRCVIRFTYAETDQGQSSDPGVITTLCSLFENGILFGGLIIAAKKAEEMRRKENGRGQFSVKELDWFSQNAYNCVVNGCESWDSKHIISMADSCLKVLPLWHNWQVFNVISGGYGSWDSSSGVYEKVGVLVYLMLGIHVHGTQRDAQWNAGNPLMIWM